MRTLVTGGAGFIGSHLVDALRARGDDVSVVDDLSGGRESNLAGALEAGAVLERIDIRDAPALTSVVAAARPRIVFHLAAQVDVRVSLADPAFDARTNEAGVIAIFCGRLREGSRPRIFGDGRQTRDYIYVADLVEALLSAGDTDADGVVNIGTEEETSVLDIVARLAELRGPDAPEPEFAPARLGEIVRSCLDAGRAREVLGWRSQTPLAEGLRLTFAASEHA
jgi:nucleoside-diphosphate-sugar epimerase